MFYVLHSTFGMYCIYDWQVVKNVRRNQRIHFVLTHLLLKQFHERMLCNLVDRFSNDIQYNSTSTWCGATQYQYVHYIRGLVLFMRSESVVIFSTY